MVWDHNRTQSERRCRYTAPSEEDRRSEGRRKVKEKTNRRQTGLRRRRRRRGRTQQQRQKHKVAPSSLIRISNWTNSRWQRCACQIRSCPGGMREREGREREREKEAYCSEPNTTLSNWMGAIAPSPPSLHFLWLCRPPPLCPRVNVTAALTRSDN